ncbi:Uncharacterised protein [Legionella beliardensis]|uniref:Uncharacterized protein n=1 Tax=Legionella beliardensis TaxID=91822 RepID=A0A378JSE8_9GAMM|nr:hypothetical protein [Legionella beliardensis]STX55602.1 Uncharacterised protein [Legionella beliardensis]
MINGKELPHFLKSLESLRNKKTEFLNAEQNSPINFVLCTHVLPDGIVDLVHLKDFADYLEAIPNTNITRVAFVLDSNMNKAASILEITLIIFYDKFLCSVNFFRLLLLLNMVLVQKI